MGCPLYDKAFSSRKKYACRCMEAFLTCSRNAARLVNYNTIGFVKWIDVDGPRNWFQKRRASFRRPLPGCTACATLVSKTFALLAAFSPRTHFLCSAHETQTFDDCSLVVFKTRKGRHGRLSNMASGSGGFELEGRYISILAAASWMCGERILFFASAS